MNFSGKVFPGVKKGNLKGEFPWEGFSCCRKEKLRWEGFFLVWKAAFFGVNIWVFPHSHGAADLLHLLRRQREGKAGFPKSLAVV